MAWKREHARAPQHTTLSLRQIGQAVKAGAFVLPAFQRRYEWTDAQVCRLFDSLLRGYHVGSLITWENDVPKGHVDFGGVVVESKGGQAQVVLDGQQRISSIARLCWTDRYAVHLLSGELLVEPEPGPWVIPAHLAVWPFGREGRDDGLLAYSPAHAARWGIDRNAVDDLVCHMSDLLNANYVSIVRLEARYTVAEVIDLFARLNAEGTRMSAADLERALGMLRSGVTI